MPLGLTRNRREPTGGVTAFGDFYAANSRQILAYFARRTFDAEASRDLTSETFAQAFQHRNRFRGSTDAEATGWLYGIARHQLSRYARKGKVERKAVDRLGIQVPRVSEDDYERIVELAGLADMRAQVLTAFSALSNDAREALRLRVIEDHSYPEVAQALGVSEQAARARVSRALRRLADAVEVGPIAKVTP